MAPVFSIVIPTCNRPSMLPRAIRSVLCQSFQDYEIVVVDDSGRQGQCAAPLSTDDPRVRLIKNPVNLGAGGARNRGVSAARGKYISFLDDDDEYMPDFLSVSLQHLEGSSHKIALTCCGVQYIDYDENDQASGVRDRKLGIGVTDENSLLKEFLSIGTGFGVVFKSSHLKNRFSFDCSLETVEDTDLFYSVIESGFFPKILPTIEVRVHNHNHQRLSDIAHVDKRIQECYLLLAKHSCFFMKYPEIRERFVAHIRNLEARAALPAVT